MREPRILSIATHDLLRASRQMVLERGGYAVVSASTLEQVEAACQGGRFDLVLLGWTVRPAAKLSAAAIVRRFWPQALVLDLCRGKSVVAGAEACSAQDPSDLLATLAGKFNDKEWKGANSFNSGMTGR